MSKNLKSLERLAFPEPVQTRGPGPGVKLGLCLLAVLAASWVHDKIALVGIVVVGLVFATVWARGLARVLRRVVVAWLIFGVILPLPSLFLAPGENSFFLVFLRVSAALVWAGAVFSSEEPHRIINALFLPEMVRDLLAMTHRYAVYLARQAWRMFMGKRARAPSRGFKEDIGFLAVRGGLLFAKTHHLSEKVARAMISRGHPGFVRRPGVRRAGVRASDLGWIFAGTVLLALALFIPRLVA